jgi:hypothetical protein
VVVAVADRVAVEEVAAVVPAAAAQVGADRAVADRAVVDPAEVGRVEEDRAEVVVDGVSPVAWALRRVAPVPCSHPTLQCPYSRWLRLRIFPAARACGWRNFPAGMDRAAVGQVEGDQAVAVQATGAREPLRRPPRQPNRLPEQST